MSVLCLSAYTKQRKLKTHSWGWARVLTDNAYSTLASSLANLMDTLSRSKSIQQRHNKESSV